MNYLKKKINKAVGNPKRKNDDDDFDNYVPEVPPHPSTLTGNKNNNFETNFADFNSIKNNNNTIDIDPLTILKQQTEQSEQQELSLEELKIKEEKYRQEERERLRQQEESKKDREEWKYFLSLTAKVDQITTKTQTVLEKLQTESAVKEISKFEDPTFEDQFDETAPKSPGAWAAFDDTADYNPSDPIFQYPKSDKTESTEKSSDNKENKKEIDEATKKIAQELIEDFGFTNLAPGISSVIADTEKDKPLINVEESTIDPFDTSYIDIEAIKSGESISKVSLIKDIDVDEIDPFDTSYIESTIQKDLTITDK